MSTTKEAVLTALGTVMDPDLHRDLVSLNMIRDLEIDGSTARFRIVLTTAACPVKQQLEDQCRDQALSVDGITDTDITMDAEVPEAKNKSDSLPGVKHVIAIASGKGGVGKSTVTANLACALAASGAKVGLLDADIYGPSQPLMMGVQREPFVENRKIIPIEAHGVKIISMGFLVEESAAMVWRGPMLNGAIKQFVTDVAWGELDYLLVDLPPGTGDVQMTLAQNAPIAGAVVVTTPQNIALLDARRGVTMFEKLNVPVFGIVENMSVFICPECGHAEPIFSADGGQHFAAEIGTNFLGAIPLEPAVREASDNGTPVVLARPESRSAVAFRHLAEQLAARVSTVAMSDSGIPE
ncbi:MAG: iron-sulfur cluster carrier protein ApbC [Planctomycetota bacterium]|jgi:ATP-binding protein involved in chromosome partitioning|nr:iron-sulfur cluster carrier protein ApbC [Planctomycetota bacterium]